MEGELVVRKEEKLKKEKKRKTYDKPDILSVHR